MSHDHTESMEIQKVEKKALSLPDRAKAIIVNSDDTYKEAGEFLRDIKTLHKAITEHHDPMIKAAHEAHRVSIAAKKKFTDPLDEAERLVKPKMAIYVREIELAKQKEREKLEREAREKAEAEALQRAKEAEAAGDKASAEQILQEAVDSPPVILESKDDKPQSEGVSTKKTWKWRLKDESKVDRKYMIVDEKKINALVRALGKVAQETVGGIEVFEEINVSVKTR